MVCDWDYNTEKLFLKALAGKVAEVEMAGTQRIKDMQIPTTW